MAEFFDPTAETQRVVLVDAQTVLRKAEKLIAGCEGCSPEDLELPFDNILDRVTGNDPAVTGLHSRSAGEVPAVPTGS